MPYTSEGTLEDVFDESFVERSSLRMVDAVGGHTVGEVADRTPVAKIPMAYGGDVEAWIEDRGGRLPGTAKRSWRASEAEFISPYRVRTVIDSSWEKIYVLEHDTKPHWIFPVRAKALRFPQGPTFRYSMGHEHPGTQGVHMLRDTMASLESGWRRPAQIALDREIARENAA